MRSNLFIKTKFTIYLQAVFEKSSKVMECTCFDKIHVYPDREFQKEYLSPETHLEVGYFLCRNFQKEIWRHNTLSEHVKINISSFGQRNPTEIKLKEKFKCHSRQFSVNSLFKLLDRHYNTVNSLEYLILRSNQQKLMVYIGENFERMLGHTNTAENFVKFLKEYLQTKLLLLKNNKDQVMTSCTKELEEELENYQHTMKILQLFYSFKDFFSVEFDKEEVKDD